MKLKLESGMDYGIGPNGEKICRGAKMGRRNTLPQDLNAPIKLQMVRLKWVDGDYDQGGAYWGCTGRGMHIYCAFAEGVQVFVQSYSRTNAKELVREKLPNAKFFN